MFKFVKRFFSRSTAAVPNSVAVDLAGEIYRAVVTASKINGTGAEKFRYAMALLKPVAGKLDDIVMQIAIESVWLAIRQKAQK